MLCRSPFDHLGPSVWGVFIEKSPDHQTHEIAPLVTSYPTPAPDIIAAEIADDPEAALEQFTKSPQGWDERRLPMGEADCDVFMRMVAFEHVRGCVR
jgi:hypothetical protein